MEEKHNEVPTRYRLKLTKEGSLKYLSHLDWQNTIIKSLYRSGLKLNFSQGFNPTPKISLGIALPIFVESVTEFIDIEFFDNIGKDELKEKLSKAFPSQIRVLDLKEIPRKEPSIDNTAEWAEYEFSPIEKDIYPVKSLLYDINAKFSENEEILIEKKNKKGIKRTIDIKPSIRSISERDNKIVMVLKAGQNQEIPSLRPDTAMELFKPEINFDMKRTKFFDGSLEEIDL